MRNKVSTSMKALELFNSLCANSADYSDEIIANTLNTVRQFRPRDANIHLKTAFHLKDMGRNDEAITAFGNVLEIQPNHFKAAKYKGKLLALSGDFNQAKKFFDHALILSDNVRNSAQSFDIQMELDTLKEMRAIARTQNKAAAELATPGH